MAKDVIVVVQRDSLPSTEESLDILLISTTGAYPVETYRDVTSVAEVYGPDGPCPNAKVVRKATTLLNQGKTTLAEGLVNKFKIVSFEPPEATPASTATFEVLIDSEELFEEPIAMGTELWAKVGADDNVVIHVTCTADLECPKDLVKLFDGQIFTKGGKTYVGKVSDTSVLFTANLVGEADTIPERFNIFMNESMSSELEVTKTIDFINGTDTLTAPNKMIKDIQTFQSDVDNDWYFLLTDRDEEEYVTTLAKFAEASEPSEAELESGVEDNRKFYMGQTSNKKFESSTARAAVIYTAEEYLNEEADASYTGNVAPFYPYSVTWKFKQPQDGNADTSEGTKMISLPLLTEGEKDQLSENNVNYFTEEYKHQYVKAGCCLDGEFIDVVLGGDWIAKRMRELLYDLLLTNANINYDDAGFGFIGTAVLQALSEAVDLNIIAVDPENNAGVYTVTIPKYAESTESDRRNRTMPDITWEALLAGAVHQVKTKGVLRASL